MPVSVQVSRSFRKTLSNRDWLVSVAMPLSRIMLAVQPCKTHPISIPIQTAHIPPGTIRIDYFAMDTKSHIQIEIESDTLFRLLESSALCVNDFRCLDCESKQCVWRLCLMSCEKQMRSNNLSCRTCKRIDKSPI